MRISDWSSDVCSSDLPKTGMAIDPALLALIEGDTLPRYFWRRVAERGAKVAMREKQLGIWRAITWAEYGDNVMHAGLGFAALGLRRGEVVSVTSEGKPEWLYADQIGRAQSELQSLM